MTELTLMQPSKLQLQELFYLAIKIAARPNTEKGGESALFDFNGVSIAEGVELSVIDENKDDPKLFALKLHIVVENKEGKTAPYDVDIEAAGIFAVIPTMPLAERDEFVLADCLTSGFGAA